MKIKYVWHESPDTEKIIDTVAELPNIPFNTTPPTQERYDKHTIELLERDKARGLVLRYEVIEP
ncbi:MAG: hypothetical protein J6S14_15655 [Clostridia bacterium]|nr:hypothetical protein [Clostridia bacterium]